VLPLRLLLFVHHCVGSRNQLVERFIYGQIAASFTDAVADRVGVR
jgi:hypothetical protein